MICPFQPEEHGECYLQNLGRISSPLLPRQCLYQQAREQEGKEDQPGSEMAEQLFYGCDEVSTWFVVFLLSISVAALYKESVAWQPRAVHCVVPVLRIEELAVLLHQMALLKLRSLIVYLGISGTQPHGIGWPAVKIQLCIYWSQPNFIRGHFLI